MRERERPRPWAVGDRLNADSTCRRGNLRRRTVRVTIGLGWAVCGLFRLYPCMGDTPVGIGGPTVDLCGEPEKDEFYDNYDYVIMIMIMISIILSMQLFSIC
jgi:hypothetical protein